MYASIQFLLSTTNISRRHFPNNSYLQKALSHLEVFLPIPQAATASILEPVAPRVRNVGYIEVSSSSSLWNEILTLPVLGDPHDAVIFLLFIPKEGVGAMRASHLRNSLLQSPC
jgi:hypothetical protein